MFIQWYSNHFENLIFLVSFECRKKLKTKNFNNNFNNNNFSSFNMIIILPVNLLSYRKKDLNFI